MTSKQRGTGRRKDATPELAGRPQSTAEIAASGESAATPCRLQGALEAPEDLGPNAHKRAGNLRYTTPTYLKEMR